MQNVKEVNQPEVVRKHSYFCDVLFQIKTTFPPSSTLAVLSFMPYDYTLVICERED